MPFNSLDFIFFLLVFSAAYYLIRSKTSRSVFILMGSMAFYAYSGFFNLFFLATTSIFTFLVVERLKHDKFRKLTLIIGIVIILVQLIYAKYSYQLFGSPQEAIHGYFALFIMPIGISFYSLQALSLLIDVYRGSFAGNLSLVRITQYLSFFPQSIAGPIHRAEDLIPQFGDVKEFVAENIVIGLKYVLLGYVCKLVVADKISLITLPVFNSLSVQDGAAIYFAAILYSLQIYFDFWGYSLIAIGVGRILGFKININFFNPYAAGSFKEFWHRWHITLSKWMRDYVYIPMGGSKDRKSYKFTIAILITFIVSGFWHGVTINFFIWGLVHAILYLMESITRHLITVSSFKLGWLTSYLISRVLLRIMFLVSIPLTWLIFRSYILGDIFIMFQKIFFFDWDLQATLLYYDTFNNIVYLIITVIILLVAHSMSFQRLLGKVPQTKREILFDSIFLCSGMLSILYLGDIGGQEFLYFRF